MVVMHDANSPEFTLFQLMGGGQFQAQDTVPKILSALCFSIQDLLLSHRRPFSFELAHPAQEGNPLGPILPSEGWSLDKSPAQPPASLRRCAQQLDPAALQGVWWGWPSATYQWWPHHQTAVLQVSSCLLPPPSPSPFLHSFTSVYFLKCPFEQFASIQFLFSGCALGKIKIKHILNKLCASTIYLCNFQAFSLFPYLHLKDWRIIKNMSFLKIWHRWHI